jgi:hypothetical protein
MHRKGKHTLEIDQCAYLEKVLECFGMQDCKPAPTPLPAGYKKKAAAKKPKADSSTSTSTTASSETDRHIAQLEHMNLELLAQLKASQDSDSESIFSRCTSPSKTAKLLDF